MVGAGAAWTKVGFEAGEVRQRAAVRAAAAMMKESFFIV
jgi:hypothetical protein